MKSSLKWLRIILGGFIGLVAGTALILYGLGQARLSKVYQVSPGSILFPDDEQSLIEGKRIFQYRGCEACHGNDWRAWFTWIILPSAR